MRNSDLLLCKESEIEKDNGAIYLPCIKGKYAFYLYLNDHPAIDSAFKARTIAPVSIITTTDNYFVFGMMADHTSLAGTILAPGGALDLNDVYGQEEFGGMKVKILDGMKRELAEEIGLDADTNLMSLTPFSFYTSPQRHTVFIIYHAKSNLSRKEIENNFNRHTAVLTARKEKPELSALTFVVNKPGAVSRFYNTHKKEIIDYIPGALKMVALLL